MFFAAAFFFYSNDNFQVPRRRRSAVRRAFRRARLLIGARQLDMFAAPVDPLGTAAKADALPTTREPKAAKAAADSPAANSKRAVACVVSGVMGEEKPFCAKMKRRARVRSSAHPRCVH